MNIPTLVVSDNYRLMIVAANIVKGLLWDSRPLLDVRFQHRQYFKTCEVYSMVRQPNGNIFRELEFNVICFGNKITTPYLGTIGDHIQLQMMNFEKVTRIVDMLIPTICAIYPNEYLNKPMAIYRGNRAVASILAGVDDTLCGITKTNTLPGWFDKMNLTQPGTLGELAQSLHIPISPKYYNIRTDSPGYRIGDALSNVDSALRNSILSNAKFHGMIVPEYLNRVGIKRSVSIITEIVKSRCAEYGIPITNNVVAHIRLSDVPPADYIFMNYARQLGMVLAATTADPVTILVGMHNLWKYPKAALQEQLIRDISILDALIEIIESAGRSWVIQSSKDIDYDFCTGCAGIAVPSGGMFSGWLKDISALLHCEDNVVH